MPLEERTDPTDEINIDNLRNLHVREATWLLRDGVPDPRSKEYHRYVLQPGDDTSGRHPLIQALAGLLWTPEVVAASQAARAAAEEAELA